MSTPPWILPLDDFRRVATNARLPPILLPVALLRDPAVVVERYGVGIRRTPAEWKYDRRKWTRFVASIQRYGIRRPPAIFVEHDGEHIRIIDGTHRILAAEIVGMPCVRVEVVPEGVDRAWAWLVGRAFRCGDVVPETIRREYWKYYQQWHD